MTNDMRPKVIQLRPRGVKTEEKKTAGETAAVAPDDARVLINSAKLQANKEIRLFREHAEKLLTFAADSVLFKDLEEPMRKIIIDEYLDRIIIPLVNGDRITGSDEADFKDFRSKMFLKLIKKYIKKEDA